MGKAGRKLAQSSGVPVADRSVADRGLFALVASHRGARAAGLQGLERAALGVRGTGPEFLARPGSGPRRITSAVIADLPDIAGAVVLSTCNRFEVYCETAPGADLKLPGRTCCPSSVCVPHGCTAAAEAVELALRRVVRQLLHVPTARARELAAAGRRDDYTAALEALYGLNVEAEARPQEPFLTLSAAG